MEENTEEIKNEDSTAVTQEDAQGIQISDDVISIIAGKAVTEIPGVAGMAGGFARRNFRSIKWKEKPKQGN